MDVQVNLIAVIAAAVVAMAAALIWYSNVLFRRFWIRLAKVDKRKVKKIGPSTTIILAVLALVVGYVLAHVTYLSSYFFRDFTYQDAAVSSAFWMWVGFVVPVVILDNLFGQNKSPWQLIAIQAGYWLVTLLGMGLVIGQIGL